MRKFIWAAALSLVFVVPVTAGTKVTICHVPAGNPSNAHTITISENALKAHLGDNEQGLHGGDYLGECIVVVEETPTPTPSPSPEEPVVELPDTAMR